MKKLRLIIPVVLISLLLTGCGFFFPFFFLNFSDSGAYEEVQELPVGADVDPLLDAEDIYWRSKLAASGRALQYSENAVVELTFVEEDFDGWIDMHYDTNVILDPDSSAVNVQTLVAFGEEQPDEFWEYYRDEDGRLVYYFYEAEGGNCSREEIPLDGKTPYVIILDYTVYGCPLDPENLSMEPQTRILNDREVYVLTFEQSVLNTFGYTGNSVRDEKLSQRYIPATWYVDAETYMPVRQEYILTQVDDLLGDLISAIYQISAADMGVAITGYTLSIDYITFDSVEVPPIPDDILRQAWANAGFSAS